jgi:uncharacterized protein (DUF3084 family)
MKILVSKLKMVVPILIVFGWRAVHHIPMNRSVLKKLAAAQSAINLPVRNKNKLESQCAAKKAELEKVKAEKDLVQQRLAAKTAGK